jgi:N-dimethylarginine dimethylaminohydrolase
MQALEHLISSLVLMRAPSPVTLNKAGANYRSEVPHLEYYPRAAYAEWLAMCDAIVASGGDAIVYFEPEDERFLDVEQLHVHADGRIVAGDSQKPLGTVNDVLTGRVFSANGPWVLVDNKSMRALLPNMLAHRVDELPYYRHVLSMLAEQAGLELNVVQNPHHWEGMADVVACGDRLLLTYTVAGHYDAGLKPKTLRSSLEGAHYAKEFSRLDPQQCVFAELVYPHFHGDTVQFTLCTSEGPYLMFYPQGLVQGFAERVKEAISAERISTISRDDAVLHYAANSRQIGKGVLVPGTVSSHFVDRLSAFGLTPHRIALTELFGKAGGGPGCATLYLPENLVIPNDAPLRYSVQRKHAQSRLSRIARTLTVDPGFFAHKIRG